jgi:hypothetical protein
MAMASTKPRARANDARVLCFRADHKSRDVLNEQQGSLMTIAGVDEVSDFLCRFGVNDTAKARRPATGGANHAPIVSDHANRNAANARVPGDHLFGIVRLKFIEPARIEQAVEHVTHLVRLAMIFGKDLVETFRWSRCGNALAN